MKFDRIEWNVIPDAATAMGALQTGEADWWEQPTFDLLPVLRRSGNLTLEKLDPTGAPSMLRFNQLFPPFDNPAIRRALLGAVDQADFMTAVAGTDRSMWRDKVGFFPPGSPLASDVGMQVLEGPRDLAKVKRELIAAGYKNEKIVVMVATDFPVLNAMGQVGADMLQKVGMNVDLQATDWGSVVQRRASRKPPAEGGWSVFFTSFGGIDQFTPLAIWGCAATARTAGSAGRRSRSWRRCAPPGSPPPTWRRRRRSASRCRPRRSKIRPTCRWASISSRSPIPRRSRAC